MKQILFSIILIVASCSSDDSTGVGTDPGMDVGADVLAVDATADVHRLIWTLAAPTRMFPSPNCRSALVWWTVNHECLNPVMSWIAAAQTKMTFARLEVGVFWLRTGVLTTMIVPRTTSVLTKFVTTTTTTRSYLHVR